MRLNGGAIQRFKEKLGNFSLLQLVFYAANAAYLPYRVVFLSSKGIPGTMIGLILTVCACTAILAQPFWGILCDKIGSIRKIFILCLAVCTVLVPMLTLVDGFWGYMILMSIISIFICPFFGLLDAWTIQGIKSIAGNPSYGSIRLWGSIGFIPIMLLMGKLSDTVSMNVVFFLYSAMNIITLIVAACVPFEGVPASRPAKDGGGKNSNPILLFKNYQYVAFIVCYCLINIAIVAQITYMPQRVAQAGGDTWMYSIMVAFGALCEIPMYLFSSRFMYRVKPVYLVVAAMILSVLHLIVLSFDVPVQVLLPLHVLRGFSYGLYLVGNVYYVDSLAPDALKTSAQSISNTFGGGIAGVLGTGIGGFMLGSSGILELHRMGAIFSAISLAIFSLSLFTRIKKR